MHTAIMHDGEVIAIYVITATLPLLKFVLVIYLIETIQWNETIHINGVKISLHPAGHIIGSSQIRVEYNGEVWVVSGDYKTENDGISGEFEPVKCNVFIIRINIWFAYL